MNETKRHANNSNVNNNPRWKKKVDRSNIQHTMDKEEEEEEEEEEKEEGVRLLGCCEGREKLYLFSVRRRRVYEGEAMAPLEEEE